MPRDFAIESNLFVIIPKSSKEGPVDMEKRMKVKVDAPSIVYPGRCLGLYIVPLLRLSW